MKKSIIENHDERISEDTFKSLKIISDLHNVDISILEIVYLKGKEDGFERGSAKKDSISYEYGYEDGIKSRSKKPILTTTSRR